MQKPLAKNFMSRFIIVPLLVACGLLLLWQGIIWSTGVAAFILPSPLRVAYTLYHHAGSLFYHLQFTLLAMLLGLSTGLILGIGSGIFLTSYKKIGRFLLPVFVLSQALPVFALAPLLVLWLGYGLASKVAMASLIIYFPVTAATYDGLRHYPAHLHSLEFILKGKPLQNLWYIRMPSALPAIASGIRIATASAPIGAIVGEWVGSAQGLGFIMLHANARMETDLMFAALSLLICTALLLYKSVDLLLSRLVFWTTDTSHFEFQPHFIDKKGEV